MYYKWAMCCKVTLLCSESNGPNLSWWHMCYNECRLPGQESSYVWWMSCVLQRGCCVLWRGLLVLQRGIFAAKKPIPTQPTLAVDWKKANAFVYCKEDCVLGNVLACCKEGLCAGSTLHCWRMNCKESPRPQRESTCCKWILHHKVGSVCWKWTYPCLSYICAAKKKGLDPQRAGKRGAVLVLQRGFMCCKGTYLLQKAIPYPTLARCHMCFKQHQCVVKSSFVLQSGWCVAKSKRTAKWANVF